MNNHSFDLTEREFVQALDQACLKKFGKTYRSDEPDSLPQIEHDFPWLFGGSKKTDP